MSNSVRFSVAESVTRLQEVEALPADWLMFFWLAGLAEKRGEVRAVRQMEMRHGTETPEGFYGHLIMSEPTMRTTIKRLKKYGIAEREPGPLKSTVIRLKER